MIRMVWCGLLALTASVANPAVVFGQASLPELAFDAPERWVQERGSPIRHTGGMLTITDEAGWVRAERIFGDLSLRFEARLPLAAARAVIVVRGRGERIWATGYALPLGSDRLPVASPQGLTSVPLNAPAVANALHATGEWQLYEIRCEGSQLLVSLNGAVIVAEPILEAPDGWIGIRAEGGSVDLRNIRIGPTTADSQEAAETWLARGDYVMRGGVTLPRVRHEERPRYTREAMAAKIQGRVLLNCVVQPDGTVGDVVVLRSLDPNYGLDEQAVRAAKKWEFWPGTKAGQPIPVSITIELSFILRQ